MQNQPQHTPKFPTGKFFVASAALLVMLLVIGMPKFNQRQQKIDGKRTTTRETKRIEHKERDELYKRETESLDFEMVFVEGGTFMMGCTEEQGEDCVSDGREEPAHQVTVSCFNVGKYVVTQAQWVAVMSSNPSKIKGDNLPINNVSWDDAKEFISKLNALTSKLYRLPTEAEWEFAARGGNKSQGYKYSGSNTIERVGWANVARMHPVGRKQPNELGIYDMSGNITEWCSDWYSESYYSDSPQNNPNGPSIGFRRVLRGGSWEGRVRNSRVSNRQHRTPDDRNIYTGFRLAQP